MATTKATTDNKPSSEDALYAAAKKYTDRLTGWLAQYDNTQDKNGKVQIGARVAPAVLLLMDLLTLDTEVLPSWRCGKGGRERVLVGVLAFWLRYRRDILQEEAEGTAEEGPKAVLLDEAGRYAGMLDLLAGQYGMEVLE